MIFVVSQMSTNKVTGVTLEADKESFDIGTVEREMCFEGFFLLFSAESFILFFL